MDLIQVMKALSDENRIRILNMISRGDLCVCELEVILNTNQSNTSRHLNKLANSYLVDCYKVSKYVYYKVNLNTIGEYPFIKEIIDKHSNKIKQCAVDLDRLKKYRDSGLSCDDLKDGKVNFDN